MPVHFPASLFTPARIAFQASVAPLVPAYQRTPTRDATKPLGVLHIVSGHSLAGVERHVLVLARAQQEAGMRVHVAFLRGGWLGEELRSSGLPHTAVALRGTADLASLAKLLRIAQREDLQVVHGHLARGMFYAMAVGKISGRASVGTDHMFHPIWVMRHLKRVVMVSAAMRTAAPSSIPEDRISVVPNGVEIDRLEADSRSALFERSSWGVPKEAPVIGMVGRITYVKGHDVFLRALSLFPCEERPYAVFAGPEEPEWGAELHELARELGVEHHVRFLGPRSNVGAVLSACTVLAVPSRMEACPLALIEALVLGVPTVASRVGGIPDIVEDGRNGLLVDAEDPAVLANALRRLLDNAGLRDRLGKMARSRALRLFTAEAMAAAMRTAYQEALDTGRRPR